MENYSEPFGVVYLLTNLVNKKMYVGQSIKGEEFRWRQHVNASKRNDSNMIIAKAIAKYGESNFSREILAKASCQEELDRLEQVYILACGTLEPSIGYNIAFGSSICGEPRERATEKVLGKKHYKWAEVDEDTQKRICKEYLSGVSLEGVSDLVCLGVKVIRKVLKLNSVSFRSNQVFLPAGDIAREYLSGVSAKQLAKKYKVDQSTIYTRLKRQGVERRAKEESIKLWRVHSLPEEQICGEYSSNSLSALGKKYSVSSSVIKRILREHGVPIHPFSFRVTNLPENSKRTGLRGLRGKLSKNCSIGLDCCPEPYQKKKSHE